MSRVAEGRVAATTVAAPPTSSTASAVNHFRRDDRRTGLPGACASGGGAGGPASSSGSSDIAIALASAPQVGGGFAGSCRADPHGDGRGASGGPDKRGGASCSLFRYSGRGSG